MDARSHACLLAWLKNKSSRFLIRINSPNLPKHSLIFHWRYGLLNIRIGERIRDLPFEYSALGTFSRFWDVFQFVDNLCLIPAREWSDLESRRRVTYSPELHEHVPAQDDKVGILKWVGLQDHLIEYILEKFNQKYPPRAPQPLVCDPYLPGVLHAYPMSRRLKSYSKCSWRQSLQKCLSIKRLV